MDRIIEFSTKKADYTIQASGFWDSFTLDTKRFDFFVIEKEPEYTGMYTITDHRFYNEAVDELQMNGKTFFIVRPVIAKGIQISSFFQQFAKEWDMYRLKNDRNRHLKIMERRPDLNNLEDALIAEAIEEKLVPVFAKRCKMPKVGLLFTRKRGTLIDCIKSKKMRAMIKSKFAQKPEVRIIAYSKKNSYIPERVDGKLKRKTKTPPQSQTPKRGL